MPKRKGYGKKKPSGQDRRFVSAMRKEVRGAMAKNRSKNKTGRKRKMNKGK